MIRIKNLRAKFRSKIQLGWRVIQKYVGNTLFNKLSNNAFNAICMLILVEIGNKLFNKSPNYFIGDAV